VIENLQNHLSFLNFGKLCGGEILSIKEKKVARFISGFASIGKMRYDMSNE
jgi:exosome complex RNA-binding protein Rrp4